jgi:hypothetical protein
MRHRRWVIFVILVLIVLPPLAVVTVRVASERPGFREAVLAKIMPDLGADLSVGDLSLGLASLTMRDIVVDLGERGQVRVPRASVDVSLQKLLTNGFDVRRAVRSILIDSPTAEIVVDAPRVGDGAAPPEPALLNELIPDYVALSDGAVTLRSRSGGALRIRSLDALAQRSVEGGVTGSVSARLQNASDLIGDFASDAGGLTFSFEVDSLSLHPELPLPATAPLVPLSGSAAVRAFVGVDPDGVSMAVSASLRDGAVRLSDPSAELRRLDADVSYDGERVTIERLEGMWGGASVEVSGAVARSPVRYEGMSIGLRDADIERVLRTAGVETLGVGGTADLDVVLNGPTDSPVVSVVIRHGMGAARGVVFSELSASCVLAGGRLTFEDVGFSAFGGGIEAYGVSEPGEGRLEVSGSASDLDAEALAAAISRLDASGRIDLTDVALTVASGKVEAEALLSWDDVRLGALTPGSGAGGVVLLGDLLAVTLESPSRGWRATSELDLSTGEPDIVLSGRLDGVALDSLAQLPPGLRGVVASGDATLEGPADSLSLSGDIRVRGPQFDAAFALSGDADLTGPGRSLRADVSARSATVRGFETSIEGSFDVLREGGLAGHASLDGLGRVEARIGPGPERAVSAGLVVSEARLEDIVAVATASAPPDALSGFVFVSASASGMLAKPVVSGQVEVADARFGDTDNLSASGSFRFGSDTLRVENLAVREDDRPFLRGAGTIVPDGPVSLSFAGEGVPGRLLGGGEDTRFDVSVGVGGTADDPALDGRVESADGEFLGIPFDDLVARVTGARGELRLGPFALERDGVYRLAAEGVLPYGDRGNGGDEEAVLDIAVDGDPIALLVAAGHMGTAGRGRGSLRASLVGNPGSMALVSATVDATSPVVRPASIIEKLTDVGLDLEVVDGAVVRGTLEGSVEGRAVKLASTRRRVIEGRMLPPLDVAGVDAGVLSLTTDGGVSVSIPGLMSSGEFGRMDVSGPAGGDELLITGPGETPTLLGEVEFSDLSFRYPFERGRGGGGTNAVLSADWSLVIRAGRNVWYRRADADIKIDEGGALEFRGNPAGGTLCLRGRLDSNRGTVTYLSRDFDVRSAFVDFPFFCEPPRFFVEAEARVEDGTTITLSVDSYEPALTFGGPGATLDESAVTLASDAPEDDSEEEILSRLRYGMGFSLLEGEDQAALERRQALDVVGGQLSMRVVRPLLAPVETRIRRGLRLDLVRIDVDFVEHFLSQLDLWRAQEGSAQYLPFLVTSRITLGKYMSRDWLLSYVGTTRAYQEDIAEQSLGLRHELGIEYEVSRNTSLSMRVVYDPVIQDWDRRLSIENRYEF